MIALHPISLAISAYLAISGFRKGSLSASGALAASASGYASMGNDLKVFGVAMIVFYLIGSKATKYKAKRKALLEEGHTTGASSGNRSAFQLGGVSSVKTACIPWTSRTCAVASSPSVPDLSKTLLYAAVGHYACCFGDTLASELGILSRSAPVLLTTFRAVPPGTNGAVSGLGLVFSALGGLLTGLTCVVSLLIENPACRNSSSWILEMLIVSTGAGLGGSILDSLLGATLQRTWFSTAEKKVLTSHPTAAQLASAQLKIVSGFDLMSNSQINMLTGILSAGTTGWWAWTHS